MPAEVADPWKSLISVAPSIACRTRELRGDMFDVIVTSEGGGQYARRCTRETRGALANA